MSTDGEGTLSALAGPTHGSEQERKRMMPEVKAERKANIHLAGAENVLFLTFPDKAVNSKPFYEGAHSRLLCLLPLNPMINTFLILITIK